MCVLKCKGFLHQQKSI